MKPLNPITALSQVLDTAHTVWLISTLIFWPMMFVLVWGVIFSNSLNADKTSSDLAPVDLLSNETLIGYLAFFVTLTVSSKLSNCLDKYSTGLERYNCFSGQCYDLALLLTNLMASKKHEQESRFSDQAMYNTILSVSRLPLIVKFVLRDDFNLEDFVNGNKGSRTPQYLMDFATDYKVAHRENPDDPTIPFQVMFERIISQLEVYKVNTTMSPLEWNSVTRRVETVYGPWGDMVTKDAYKNPRFMQSFMLLLLYMFYASVTPFFIIRFESLGSAMLVNIVLVFIFSGCYEAASKITNPFESASEYPFFFASYETATAAGEATVCNIERLLKTRTTDSALRSSSVRSHIASRRPTQYY